MRADRCLRWQPGRMSHHPVRYQRAPLASRGFSAGYPQNLGARFHAIATSRKCPGRDVLLGGVAFRSHLLLRTRAGAHADHASRPPPLSRAAAVPPPRSTPGRSCHRWPGPHSVSAPTRIRGGSPFWPSPSPLSGRGQPAGQCRDSSAARRLTSPRRPIVAEPFGRRESPAYAIAGVIRRTAHGPARRHPAAPRWPGLPPSEPTGMARRTRRYRTMRFWRGSPSSILVPANRSA